MSECPTKSNQAIKPIHCQQLAKIILQLHQAHLPQFRDPVAVVIWAVWLALFVLWFFSYYQERMLATIVDMFISTMYNVLSNISWFYGKDLEAILFELDSADKMFSNMLINFAFDITPQKEIPHRTYLWKLSNPLLKFENISMSLPPRGWAHKHNQV